MKVPPRGAVLGGAQLEVTISRPARTVKPSEPFCTKWRCLCRVELSWKTALSDKWISGPIWRRHLSANATSRPLGGEPRVWDAVSDLFTRYHVFPGLPPNGLLPTPFSPVAARTGRVRSRLPLL